MAVVVPYGAARWNLPRGELVAAGLVTLFLLLFLIVPVATVIYVAFTERGTGAFTLINGLVGNVPRFLPPGARQLILDIPYSGPAVVLLHGRADSATLRFNGLEHTLTGSEAAKLSPVIMLPSTSTLTVRGARGRLSIEIWETAQFPASREA